jgi:hypothetical protein
MNGYWFTSHLFAVEPGEDDEVNPGMYGRQLADWLKGQLEGRGYAVEPVIAEDWGRCLMLSRDPFLLWVGCGSIHFHSADIVESTEIVWHCFPEAEVPFFRRLFGKPDTGPELSRLNEHLRSILEQNPAIKMVDEP